MTLKPFSDHDGADSSGGISSEDYHTGQYCKRGNIRGGFNFAMFAVDDFSAKLKPPRSFYNTAVYSYLLLHVDLKSQIPRNLNYRERSPSRKPRNFSTAKLKPFTVVVLIVTSYVRV